MIMENFMPQRLSLKETQSIEESYGAGLMKL